MHLCWSPLQQRLHSAGKPLFVQPAALARCFQYSFSQFSRRLIGYRMQRLSKITSCSRRANFSPKNFQHFNCRAAKLGPNQKVGTDWMKEVNSEWHASVPALNILSLSRVAAELCRTSLLGGRVALSRWHINQHEHSAAYLSTPPPHPWNVTSGHWGCMLQSHCFEFSLRAGVTVPRTSCRPLASTRSVRRSSCSQICPLSFFFSPKRWGLIPLDILTKRVTLFQVGHWRDASASAALLVVTV